MQINTAVEGCAYLASAVKYLSYNLLSKKRSEENDKDKIVLT